MKKSILTIAVILFTVAAAIYMIVTSFGGTKTFWGWDAGHTEWYFKVLMIIILGFAVFNLIKLPSSGAERIGGRIFLILLLITVGFAASTGFKFTGGDIKQRISYLDNLGKVKDTTVLFRYYEDFYHFKTDTALKNYVITYGELPGRNRWNSYILAGDEPRSTAPRSDEDFKWHTGAYEMDLKKKLE